MSRSSVPKMLVAESSAPKDQRARRLDLHDFNLRDSKQATRPAKSHSRLEKPSREEPLDSANMQAARVLLQKRTESGLTQEELAALSGESRKQVHRRESNKVFLGPLRALVVLERAAGLKKVPSK